MNQSSPERSGRQPATRTSPGEPAAFLLRLWKGACPMERSGGMGARAAVSLALLVSAVGLAASGRPAQAAPDIAFSGYIQLRFELDQAKAVESDFLVRRAKLKAAGKVSDRVSFTLQLDAAREVVMNDAYVDVQLGEAMTLRAGQTKVPFLDQVLISSSARLEPERTQMSRILFPSERDIGAVLTFGAKGRTQFTLAAFNGNGVNKSDNNDAKDLMARVTFPLQHGVWYLAGYTGEFTSSSGTTTDRTRVGAGAQYQFGRFGVRGEFLTGEDKGADVTGFYGLAWYQVRNPHDTVFLRIEEYDENDDLPSTTYRGIVVGWEHWLDQNTRVVLAHELRDPDAGFSKFTSLDGDLTTVQLQVKF